MRFTYRYLALEGALDVGHIRQDAQAASRHRRGAGRSARRRLRRELRRPAACRRAAGCWDAHYLDGRTPVRQAGPGDHRPRGPRDHAGRRAAAACAGRSPRCDRPRGSTRASRSVSSAAVTWPRPCWCGDRRLPVRAAGGRAAGGRGRFTIPRRRRYRVGADGARRRSPRSALAIGLYFWGIPALATVAGGPRARRRGRSRSATRRWPQLAPPPAAASIASSSGASTRSPRRCCTTLPEPRYPFRVIVVNNPTVNALATPGGSIVVFRGLLERTENAEELAGVLAHEIQHVMHRHATRRSCARPPPAS